MTIQFIPLPYVAAWFRDHARRMGISRPWQDLVLSTSGVVFIASLLPSVFGDSKPEPSTSFLTSAMIYTTLAVHRSYRLWFACTTTFTTATLWLVLAIQAVSA